MQELRNCLLITPHLPLASTTPPRQHTITPSNNHPIPHNPQIQFQGRLFNQTPMPCNLFCAAVLTIRSLSLPFGCLPQLNHARAEKCISKSPPFSILFLLFSIVVAHLSNARPKQQHALTISTTLCFLFHTVVC